MRPFVTFLFVDPGFQKIRYRAAIFLYLMVLVLGSIPDARADLGEFASGLILHTLTYAVLAVLLFTGSSGSAAQRAAKSILTIMAMGAIDKAVQSFFPYRTAAWSDWLVDCLAGALASGLVWAFWPKSVGTECLTPDR